MQAADFLDVRQIAFPGSVTLRVTTFVCSRMPIMRNQMGNGLTEHG